MAIVRSIADQTPPPRYDGTAWKEVKIEEAREGEVFTVVATVTLTADADPTTPAPRSFTFTVAAENPAETFRLTWLDKSGNEFAGPIMRYIPLPPWAPSVDDVATFIRARTKTKAGNTVGTFTAETTITRQNVEATLPRAVRRVATEVGVAPCTSELEEDAGTAAAMYCAMLLEQSFFPDQTGNSGSSFKSLETLFIPALKSLCAAVHSQCGTTAGGGEVVAVGGTFDSQGIISRENPQAW